MIFCRSELRVWHDVSGQLKKQIVHEVLICSPHCGVGGAGMIISWIPQGRGAPPPKGSDLPKDTQHTKALQVISADPFSGPWRQCAFYSCRTASQLGLSLRKTTMRTGKRASRTLPQGGGESRAVGPQLGVTALTCALCSRIRASAWREKCSVGRGE